MYGETVTIFNRWRGADGDLWYPTVLRGVNLCRDRAAIIRRYGSESGDRALLNVRYLSDRAAPGGSGDAADAADASPEETITVGGKLWLPPRVWRQGDESARTQTVTFSGGELFDIFMPGQWDGGVAADAEHDRDGGFYGWLNRTRDDVFAVTAVSGAFVLIPHFEITGR